MRTPIFLGDTFYSSDTKPTDYEGHGDSEDVLIDVDGKRKTFQIGWYSFLSESWRLYQPRLEIQIDLKKMRWTHLPINREI